MKGVYTLLLHLREPRIVEVGALGRLSFKPGLYAYVGSARGPGGLSRVGRHMGVARGENTTRRWHIDYLLPHATLKAIFVSPTHEDLECQLAQEIGRRAEMIEGFGCSDCSCTSHLFHGMRLEQAVREAHRSTVGAFVRVKPSQ